MSVTLMRGRIGSGKSYKARRICAETGALLLSVDRLLEGVLGSECPGRERYVKAERGALRYLLDLAKALDRAGVSAVIDHGFWSAADLRFAESFLAENGIASEVVVTKADFDTRLERVCNRSDGRRFDREKLKLLDGYYEETED